MNSILDMEQIAWENMANNKDKMSILKATDSLLALKEEYARKKGNIQEADEAVAARAWCSAEAAAARDEYLTAARDVGTISQVQADLDNTRKRQRYTQVAAEMAAAGARAAGELGLTGSPQDYINWLQNRRAELLNNSTADVQYSLNPTSSLNTGGKKKLYKTLKAKKLKKTRKKKSYKKNKYKKRKSTIKKIKSIII